MKRKVVFFRIYQYFFLSVALLGLSACTGFHPARETAPLKVPSSFSESGHHTVENRWWREFDDRLLWQAVERSLNNNFTIRSAFERIKAASAQVEKARAPLFPWLDVEAGASHTTTKEGSSYLNSDDIFFDGAVSYELDLWGRIRSGLRASEFDLAAQQADYEAARLSLSSQVAIKYFEITSLQRALGIIARQIERNRESLNIIDEKFRMGQTDSLDLWQQQQLVEQNISKKIEVQKAIDVARKELALLMGLPATRSNQIDTSSALPPLPPLPNAGIPVSVLKRRPDCARAFLKLKAANQRLAEAVYAQYPQLLLSGTIRTDSSAVKDLLENWVAALSSSVLTPLFEGGRLQAEVKAQEAKARELLYDYAQTLLRAIKEVEDSLQNEEHQRALVSNLEARVELARKTTLLLKEKYVAGDVEYLRFLASQINVDELERQLVEQRFVLIKNRIRLYKAVSGPIPATLSPNPSSKGKR